jgi:hypothetical protein
MFGMQCLIDVQVRDLKFPPGMAVYAHGELAPWNLSLSMTPAVVFSLVVTNPSNTQAMDASLLLSLPLAIQ